MTGRAAILLLLGAALAACGSAPSRKAPPVAERVPPPTHRQDGDAPKRSPYAPAQEDPSKRGDYVAGGLYAPGVPDTVPDPIPDVDAIPEPVVRDEPPSAIGNRDYAVLGKRYQVRDRADGYVEQGMASFYGNKFHGRRTSNHEVYDMYAFSAAHRTLPLPCFVRVTNLDNGKSVVVRVNDRGPFHSGRIIDLSYAAAAKLGFVRQGTARVEVRALRPGEERDEHRDDGRDDDTRVAVRAPTPPAAPADPALSADEFERWMRERGIRVATGAPADPGAASRSEPAPPATTVAAGPGEVLVQVGAYSARENADRARDRLAAGGLAPVRIDEGSVDGRPVWRLRLGPVPEAQVPELSRRAADLGFAAAQIVRD
jgi:rare lipoprotein A